MTMGIGESRSSLLGSLFDTPKRETVPSPTNNCNCNEYDAVAVLR